MCCHISKPQKPAFVAEIRCRVLILLRRNVTSAFMGYIIYGSIPYQSKVILTEETVVLNLRKITEVRKQKIKVEILHDFENNFKILIDFYNLGLTLFSKNSLLQNNLA